LWLPQHRPSITSLKRSPSTESWDYDGRPNIPNFHLWSDVRLVERALDAGLFNWLLQRVR
jgi:hypothetical protein